MKTALVVTAIALAFFFGTLFIVRIAVGFVRWARKHQAEAGEWLFLSYCRDSFGQWVDDVAESPAWFPFEGTGHSDAGGPSDGGADSNHSCGGGDGGSVCGD